jgi:hypothetical protein
VSDPQPTRRSHLEAVASAGAVAIALKSTWGIGHLRDVYLNDESVYLASGVRMFVPGFPNDAHGLPPPDWSPLYAWWYRALHVLVHEPVHLYYASWTLLVLLASATLYVVQRKLEVPPLVALGAIFVLDIARFFDFWPYAANLVVGIFGVGLIAALSARTDRAAARSLVHAATASIFIRPELAVTAGLLALWGAVVTVMEVRRDRRAAKAAAADGVLVLGTAALLFRAFGDPFGSGRSFFAWGQHYAVAVAEREHIETDAWINWTSIVQRDFGAVDTIAGALRANPAAFARNVLHNAGDLPSQLADAVTPFGFFPQTPVMIAYVVLLTLGAIGAVARWRRGGPGARRLRIVAVTCFTVGINTIPGALIIQPHHHYLLLFTALSMVLVAAGLPDGLRLVARRLPAALRDFDRPPSLRGALLAAGVLLLLTPNRAYGACLQTWLGIYAPPTPDNHETRRTAAAIGALGLDQPATVLEQGYSYAFYSGVAFDRVLEWTKDRPFATWLREHDVNLIVISVALLRNGAFADDPEFQAFVFDPQSYGFRTIPVAGTMNTLALRDDVRARGLLR